MSVFAPMLSSLWRQIEDYGIDPGPLFRKQGIVGSAPFDPNTRVSAIRIDRVMVDAAERSGDQFFGLKEANYFLPSHIGPLGFAWLASTSLRSAIERLQRYIKVIHEKIQITTVEDPQNLEIRIHADIESANSYQRDIGYLAVLTRMCRFVSGDDWNPVRVCVAHPQPIDASYFFQMFRCPVEFNTDFNAICIDTCQAGRALTGSNKQLAQLNDHIVVRYLASQMGDDIVNRVKAAILEHLGEGSVSEATVAKDLHMSSRKLHRRLSSENSSFKAVLLEIRTELANQYVNDASLTLTEISYMLGFSEISSFSRAYKRWTGQSPSMARKSQEQHTAI